MTLGVKFNMGCGLNKAEGFVNVDSAPQSAADEIWDLEQTPWPWPDSCATEVRFIHSLEHMGADSRVFLAIVKELYRIAADGCQILIYVPHPRHDDFIGDPTHVRPVTPQMLTLFDRALNEEWRASGASNTPMALYCDVDFKVSAVQWVLADAIEARRKAGEITDEDVRNLLTHQSNVCREIRILWVARKPGAPPAHT